MIVKRPAPMMEPRFNSPAKGFNIPGLPGLPAEGSSVMSWDRIKSTIINKYGLTPQMADLITAQIKKEGKLPSKETISRYVDTYGRKTEVKPLITLPQIDNAVMDSTGVNFSTASGFGRIDPTPDQNFFQKNKQWLIPAGIAAVGLGLYFITKKQ